MHNWDDQTDQLKKLSEHKARLQTLKCLLLLYIYMMACE